MSSILTNASAMTALRVLEQTNTNLSKTQNRIATGLKVSSAKDNASFWAVSTTMKSDVNSFKAISDNLSLAENSLSVARVGAEKITDLIDTIKTKTTQAQEGSISKEKLQADIDEALKQIEEITSAANFNGVKLLEEDTDVRLLSSIGRSGSGVESSYISFTSQNLAFGPGGGLESIKGLSVLDRGAGLVENKTDGVSVHDIGGIDTRRVRIDTSAAIIDTGAGGSANNDYVVRFVDETGAAASFGVTDFTGSDMEGLAAALRTAGGTDVDSVSWDEEKGLTINFAQGRTFTAFHDGSDSNAATIDTIYTADKGNELTFTYQTEDGITRELKHTLSQDITANAEGAAALVKELNNNSDFAKLFTVSYDSNSSTFKISNADRSGTNTLTGWSGATFTKNSEVTRFSVGINGGTTGTNFNLTTGANSTENDFAFTYKDADGVTKSFSLENVGTDWNAFVTAFDTAAQGIADATYDATNGLTISWENGATYVSAAGILNATASHVASATPVDRETTTNQTSELNFKDAPLRLSEEITLNYEVNGVNKEVVFKVTGNKTETGTRIDDESNPNRIVLALDAREVTDASTTGEKVASEIKSALDSMSTALKTSFGINSTAATQHTNIQYGVDGAKLTLTAAGGFDNLKTATLPTTDYQSLLDNLESALQTATDAAASLGSAQGRIDIQKEFLGALSDSLKVGIGTLVDANMNEESARLQALQVQQQLGIQSLSIANQAPQALLSLFR